MDISIKTPFYAKVALVFIGLFAFVFTLHLGKEIIVPILFATIVAILLNPLVTALQRKKVNRVIAISIAVVLAILVVVGLFAIISSQVTMFSETYPQLKSKFNETSNDLIYWISKKFNIRQSSIKRWINETEQSAINDFAIGESISQVGQMLIFILLLPVYLYLILYYKTLLLEFIRKLFRSEHHFAVVEVLSKSKNIIQNYLVGLFFEMVIISILNSAGLLLLGIDDAIILGITGAILNIIPYIGGIFAIALTMIIAFVTKETVTYPIMVLVIYLIIQFIDNHFIVPGIVASRVKINALVSIVVVLVGNAIWGIPGMFLSIPLTAIVKVIFDNIDPLKPWGFLLGNIVPSSARLSLIKQRK
jgi:predicted PurR-regulated permease PerM